MGRALAERAEFATDPDACAWLWKDHTSTSEAMEITQAAAKAHPEYLAFTICAAIVAAVAARALHHFKSAFLVVDALGLVAFTIIGCDIARSFANFHPAIVVMLGMVGYFAAVVQAPLTATIIVMEMTANQQVTVALMATSFLGFAVSRLVCPRALYGALAKRFLLTVEPPAPPHDRTAR